MRGVIAASSASGAQLEAGVDPAWHDHRRRPHELDDVGIADPIGRGDDDLVADVERRRHRVEDRLLAADVDGDLVEPVVEAVVASELGLDRGLQFGRAVDLGVFGLATTDRRDGGILDEIGGIEVGLARAEADDVAALALQLRRLVGDGDRRRRLDALDRGGEHGHGAAFVGTAAF